MVLLITDCMPAPLPGSIVNAALGSRYLLTADHCFTDKAEISDFEYWLLIFNYQTSCNNSTAPPFTQVVQVEF